MKRMVIGLPRSGTTWAANWLTYGGETCVHDPLYHTHYSEWDATYDAVSCTGIYDWPEFVAAQTCPVLVLRRDIGAVKASLLDFDKVTCGAWLPWEAERQLDAIRGPNITHVEWDDMFHSVPAENLWRFLQMPSQFDAVRHKHLAQMNVQPRDPFPPDADRAVHRRLMSELREKRERANNVL